MSGGAQFEKSVEKGLGTAIHDAIARLFPLCRSITGDGVRASLAELGRIVPLTVHEVPSGTRVFDWKVPDEWNIRDAWVKDSSGNRVIDFQQHNLHVVSYSAPVRQEMSLEQLRPHLHTLPEMPDRIPYRTSYYNRDWGFCLSHAQLNALVEDSYEVCIDSSLEAGHLSYGELLIPGDSGKEVLVSCHICHPSMANDNLSGMAVAAFLARSLGEIAEQRPLRYSYRFLFVPGTIGSLTWLAQNETTASRISHGLTLACLGDDGHFTYKRSRQGDAIIDRVAARVLRQAGDGSIVDFSPFGYDERQYCSPGFNLPIGSLTRSTHGSFPEYHTDADNLSFITAECLEESLLTCLRILSQLEDHRPLVNQKPHGEPQLGKYGLYGDIGGVTDAPNRKMALLWVLNLADGNHSLTDIAERAGLELADIEAAAEALESAGLVRPQD